MIVVLDIVPIGQGRVYGTVGLERPDPEVDRIRGVPHQDLGPVVSRHTVYGPVLGETGEDRGSAPHLLAEESVNVDLALDSRRRHVQLGPHTLVDGCRRSRLPVRRAGGYLEHCKYGKDHVARSYILSR